MAIENALIAKIVGGVSVIGGAGSAGVVYRNELYNAFSSVQELKAEDNSYLITKATNISETNKNKLILGKEKNYYCQIKDEKNKIDCEVSLVVFDNKKTVDLKTVKDLNSSTEKKTLEDLNVDSYYKLKLNKEDLTKFDFSSEKTIDLVTNSAWSSTKYATLKPEFKVNGDVIKTKNDFFLVVIATVTSAGSGEAAVPFTNYKCTIDSILTAQTKCVIHKFSEDSTDIDFSKKTLSPVQIDTEIPATPNLAVIQIMTTNEAQTSKIVKNKVIKFEPYSSDTETSPISNKKTYSFTVSSQLFGDISTSTSGMFLKE